MSTNSMRLNVVLASGLVVVSAKFRKESPVATLFVTDFTHDTRIMLDLEGKRVLANRDDIALTDKDIEAIMAALPKDLLPKPKEPKPKQKKTVSVAGTFLERALKMIHPG